ncbi:PaaI family thioesterase [Desertibacillus haloalkaliphilus]|nr:PaaI family thioesterase [Desertibacillus haloalkaliphilus]
MVNDYLEEANREEKEVLLSILKGLKQKQEEDHSTYLGALTQIESRSLENGDLEMTLPIQPIIENPLKMVHGGITATLLDTTMGTVINEHLPKTQTVVTSEIKVNYLKPGIGNYLRCVASLVHHGKQLCVTEAKVYTDTDQLVAMGTGTFFIIERP